MKRLATVLRMACASAALAAAETSAAPSVSLAFPEEAAPKGCAPAKGLVLWRDTARARPDLSSAVSLEFSYCLPCDVAVGTNAEGGVAYDWRPFDAILDDIASRRHQAVVRFRYAYPGERLGGVKGATAVPSFLKSRSDYRETFAGNPGGDGPTWYPDWSCRALEDFTLEFYGALAKRYDDDPRLAFLEVGFGHWAEYHTYGTPLRPGVNFPSVDFQRRFFRLLASGLKSTPWMVSIDSAARGEQHSPAVELCASGVRFGLFDDSFLDLFIGSSDQDVILCSLGLCLSFNAGCRHSSCISSFLLIIRTGGCQKDHDTDHCENCDDADEKEQVLHILSALLFLSGAALCAVSFCSRHGRITIVTSSFLVICHIFLLYTAVLTSPGHMHTCPVSAVPDLHRTNSVLSPFLLL